MAKLTLDNQYWRFIEVVTGDTIALHRYCRNGYNLVLDNGLESDEVVAICETCEQSNKEQFTIAARAIHQNGAPYEDITWQIVELYENGLLIETTSN
jgi:hypothetical protein